MKPLKNRHLIGFFLTLFLSASCSLTSCISFEHHQYINEFATETDKDAIKRMSDWSVDLPKDTQVISRYHTQPECWDCGFWSAYYIFEVDNNYSFNSELISMDFVSFESKWDSLYSSDWLSKEKNWPSFDTPCSCLIIVRWKDEINARKNQDGADNNSFYSMEYLSVDKNYSRRQNFNDFVFVGKAYIILQNNQKGSKNIYAFFSIDNLEVKSYIVS